MFPSEGDKGPLTMVVRDQLVICFSKMLWPLYTECRKSPVSVLLAFFNAKPSTLLEYAHVSMSYTRCLPALHNFWGIIFADLDLWPPYRWHHRVPSQIGSSSNGALTSLCTFRESWQYTLSKSYRIRAMNLLHLFHTNGSSLYHPMTCQVVRALVQLIAA